MSACARCQSNPSSPNFALTTPTQTPKHFCSKNQRSAALTFCWGVEFPLISCIRAGMNTSATCICTEMNSLKNLANMQKMVPRKYFPVFAQVRIQAPHVFAQKLIPQDIFPACIGLVPGGKRIFPGFSGDFVYMLFSTP